MLDRRDLLRASAFFTAASYSRILGANDRIRIAGIGVGGRATYLLGLAAKAEGTEIVAVCDVSEPRRLAAKQKFAPAGQDYLEYRTVLGRKDIDGVVIGAPDHWHIPMMLDAIASGKDVYVEKPVSHHTAEGERAEKEVLASNRIVQVGYQQRSWPHFIQARDYIASGKLGQITLVLTSWYQDYVSNLQKPVEIDPATIDWKRFLGSAPDQPFDALRYRHWRWFWDFGNGHLTDLHSHYGDVAHWFMGQYAPRSAQAAGSRNAIPHFECPDTIAASWDYPGFTMLYHGALNGSLDGGNIVFRGHLASMKLNRDGFAVYEEGKVRRELTTWPPPDLAVESQGDGTIAHMQNFLDCMRSRKPPNAGITTSVAAARAAHLANAAYRSATVWKTD
ncbi:MAG TPA: Gfo/Idh/MocA family oxidoreductase [Candidatus Sulfopaludibacter sp.]|nr:Gfo/Idh/MocA family oxidoreductase [Candidatus Sulfopaludibacter sp.]